ncbi:MAG: aminoglycoside 3'-phosphotransferase [Oscillospiraceae bacterium]|nr:aminoglycoside 3'-phosphotransferase [Oscillospiraceae bacterium]
MTLKPIGIEICQYPLEFQSLLRGAKLYDSSCSPEAKVIFIDKDTGYFLKSAPKGKLEREADMTRYFHSKGLSAEVLAYVSNEQDWLLTKKVSGNDCITAKYLEQPERLCDILAERLYLLHGIDYTDCPVENHTKHYLELVEFNRKNELYDKSHFPDSFGYQSPEEAWAVVDSQKHLLQNDTLLHGDYCLPNIILDDWRFSGFIDLDNSGIGDRHVDLFWGTWTLFFNLKTHKYRDRFLDAYGREKVDEGMLRLVAAAEAFG